MIDENKGAPTGIQIAAARMNLQHNAELHLGRFLFSFAHLESALDLCIVWVDQGREYEKLTRKIERLNFAGKLDLLQAQVDRATSIETRSVYGDWLQRVHTVREQRNALVHGRLGLDVMRRRVTVVLSRAPSTDFESVEFSLPDLEVLIGETRILRDHLCDLRTQHPL